MSPEDTTPAELQALLGQQVVLDTRTPFVYIGTLQSANAESLTLTEVDVHDARETTTSTDRYLIETVKHGIRVNRRRVIVLAREVVSVCALSDVVPY